MRLEHIPCRHITLTNEIKLQRHFKCIIFFLYAGKFYTIIFEGTTQLYCTEIWNTNPGAVASIFMHSIAGTFNTFFNLSCGARQLHGSKVTHYTTDDFIFYTQRLNSNISSCKKNIHSYQVNTWHFTHAALFSLLSHVRHGYSHSDIYTNT